MQADVERARLAADLGAVGQGDRAALRRVYSATSSKLFGVCVRILKHESDAEDVLQEVYVTVWRKAGSFDPARGVSPITWLAALARNRAIDRLRASREYLQRPMEALADTPDAAPLASAEVERREADRRLNACLETLEPTHAACVRAAFFDGRTYAGLAQDADVPLGTMKSWIRRALQRLKTCLDA